MSSAQAKLSSRASKVSNLSSKIEFTESKIPAPTQNFADSFKLASGARKDFSNEFTVDVLPNFVPLLCYILYHVNQYVPFLEATKHAKISAASFTAYCLTIIYGYILYCDMYIRTSPSTHAAIYDEDSHRKRFVEFLASLPVPDFIEPILRQLTPSVDETRGNISFVPSAAGFSYIHHFGRIFPIIMFTNIHDCIAENESRQSRLATISNLFSRAVYTITAINSGSNAFTASIGHFIGAGISIASTPSHYGSKLFQLFTSLFNPVLFRDYQRRQSLASIALQPLTFPTEKMNFYDFVFSATPQNLSELRTVFSSVAAALNGNVKCPGDLASFFSIMSGTSIFTHGYSMYALPTFFHSDITYGNADGSELTDLKRVTPATFASAIKYLQTPNPTAATAHSQPSGTCTVDRTHPVTATFTSIFNRLGSTSATGSLPNPSEDFEIFDESRHLYPRVYVLNPFDPTTVDAWKATAFGMVIETMDIDGTVIAMPNTDLNLGIENSWFSDSAIPYRYCHKAISFRSGSNSPTRALKRVLATRQTRLPAASLLIDRTRIALPRAAPTTVSATPDAAYFPGLSSVENVTWLQMLQSFLGFRTSDRRDHDSTSDQIPGMQSHRLMVWSPYSYTGYSGDDDFDPDQALAKIYFITNLRTLFGTRAPLVEVNSALDSMPIF